MKNVTLLKKNIYPNMSCGKMSARQKYGEMSHGEKAVRRNVPRRNVLTAKCPYGKMSDGKVSHGEKSHGGVCQRCHDEGTENIGWLYVRQVTGTYSGFTFAFFFSLQRHFFR